MIVALFEASVAWCIFLKNKKNASYLTYKQNARLASEFISSWKRRKFMLLDHGRLLDGTWRHRGPRVALPIVYAFSFQ